MTALVVAAALLIAGPAPSLASTSPSGPVVTASSSGAVVAAGSRGLPRRTMNDEVFRNAKGWLVFKGDVDPGWNDKSVQVFKRLCKKGCPWTLVKKVRTDGSGRWSTRVYAPRTGSWYWKGMVPKAGGYGTSVTRVWRTYVD